MNMSKSRDIQAKMPSPKVIYASNESKSVLARNLEECRDNDKNSQSVFLSFKCIFARNCEVTEQLQSVKREPGKRSGSLFLMKILCIAKRVTGNGVNNSHSVNILRIMRHTSCICSGNMVVYKK